MAVNLKKGNSVNLTKEQPTLNKIMVGLGWDTSSLVMDLDASAFMLERNGKVPNDNYFVFYNNLKSQDGALQHTGDNRTGEGEGDDEMLLVNLSVINTNISEIIFTVSIHDAKARGHHFGLVKNAFIRLYDIDNKTEILRYTLDEKFENYSEIEFGKLIKADNNWSFTAMGNGSSKGLQGFVDIYI